jgi:hypothetical protein
MVCLHYISINFKLNVHVSIDARVLLGIPYVKQVASGERDNV